MAGFARFAVKTSKDCTRNCKKESGESEIKLTIRALMSKLRGLQGNSLETPTLKYRTLHILKKIQSFCMFLELGRLENTGQDAYEFRSQSEAFKSTRFKFMRAFHERPRDHII